MRCQEIFDYSTYDAEDSVRFIVGMGQPMDYEPPMVAAGIPSMVWGGQVRLVARALGVEVDELRETVERRALDASVTTALGEFAAGTQGALRFEVQGIVGGGRASSSSTSPGSAPPAPTTGRCRRTGATARTGS